MIEIGLLPLLSEMGFAIRGGGARRRRGEAFRCERCDCITI